MKRLPRAHRDPHLWASDVVSTATGQPPTKGLVREVLARQAAAQSKNPAAVALGKLGGKKGGKARAAALNPKTRAEIARKGAEARWGSDDVKAQVSKMVESGATGAEIARTIGISLPRVDRIKAALAKSHSTN